MPKFACRLTKQRLFLWLLPLAIVFASLVLFVSARDFLFKKTCGCGPLTMSPSGEFEAEATKAIFNNNPIKYDFAELPEPESRVLGESDENKWIEINLSEQKLYAHEGGRIVYEFLVSTGKPWTPTVTGDFRIWTKMRYTKMSGGSRTLGNYYYLPNVPYTQYFYRDYGLHGTYWHNNFGHTMSHGCVNLATPDAEKLFYWTSPPVPAGQNVAYPTQEHPGTRVVVHK